MLSHAVDSDGSLLIEGDLIRFYDNIVEKWRPHMVVALARKMPRILEAAGIFKSATVPIVSERALPWLDATDTKRRNILICDDVLNCGTTLRHYGKCARDYGLGEPRLAVYALRQREHMPDTTGIEVHRSFEEHDYVRFETLLPQRLLAMGKPYDIDFPIITLQMSEDEAARTTDEWYEVFAQRFGPHRVHELTTLTQREANVSSFSLFHLFSDNEVDCAEVSGNTNIKARIYVSGSQRVLRIVPICVKVVDEDLLRDGDPDLPVDLLELYKNMRPNSCHAAPFELEPLFNLYTFLYSFSYGQRLAAQIRDVLLRATETIASVDIDDLRLLFGPTFAASMAPKLNEALANCRQGVTAPAIGSVSCPRAQWFNQDLSTQALQALPKNKLRPDTIMLEAISLVRAIMGAENQDTANQVGYRRLRTGLSLPDMWQIAQHNCDTLPSFDEMSFYLDYYVDLGAMVPVVSCIDSRYTRVYRAGEATPMGFAALVWELLNEHGQPLSKTLLNKILAVVALYHKDTPLTPVFDYRGRVAYIASQEAIWTALEPALDYLEAKSAIALSTTKTMSALQPELNFDLEGDGV